MSYTYDPLPKEMKWMTTVQRKDLVGDQAFDISRDGKRLAVLDAMQIVLIDTETGERERSIQLPDDLKQEPAAIRFCGDSDDLLIASSRQIVRLHGDSGKVIRQRGGVGSNIRRWEINPSDSSMMILTGDERLFLGDPQLRFLSAADVGSAELTDSALSPDGTRVCAIDNGKACVFELTNNRVLRKQILDDGTLDGTARVASGYSSDCWVDQKNMMFVDRRSSDESGKVPNTTTIDMLWRPHQSIACTMDSKGSWFLTVGERVIDRRRQWILFDFGPNSRQQSVAMPIDEKPKRLVANSNGSRVALLMSDGLRLYHKAVYPSPNRYRMKYLVYKIVDAGPIEQIEKTYDAIGRQNRWTIGHCPSEIQSLYLYEIALRWLWLERNAESLSPELTDALQRMRDWRKAGGVLAVTVSAVRHDKNAWDLQKWTCRNSITTRQSGNRTR